MARRSRRSASLNVGLVGAGTASAKSIKQELSGFIEAQDTEITWVFPLSEDTPKPLQTAVEFLYEEGASYVLIDDGTTEDADLTENAQEVVEAEDAQAGVVAYIAKAEGESLLVILLDEEHDGDYDLLTATSDEGIRIKDLASAMIEIDFVDVEGADDAEDEAEGDEGDGDDPADSDALGLPEDAAAAIEAGDVEGAVDILKELSKSDLAEIAEGLGLEVAKGQHRKTIADDIVGYLVSGVQSPSDEDDDSEVTEEVVDVAEVEAEVKPARKGRQPAAEGSGTANVSLPLAKVEETVKDPDVPTQNNGYVAERNRAEVLHALATVAAAKGAAESEKFLKVLQDANLA